MTFGGGENRRRVDDWSLLCSCFGVIPLLFWKDLWFGQGNGCCYALKKYHHIPGDTGVQPAAESHCEQKQYKTQLVALALLYSGGVFRCFDYLQALVRDFRYSEQNR